MSAEQRSSAATDGVDFRAADLNGDWAELDFTASANWHWAPAVNDEQTDTASEMYYTWNSQHWHILRFALTQKLQSAVHQRLETKTLTEEDIIQQHTEFVQMQINIKSVL